MLNRLVYFSERCECDDATLRDIVARAAPRNREADVTGLILAGERTFIQVLEGPRTAVSMLFQDICRDQRHRNIVLAEMTEIVAYTFPRWGLAQTSDPAKVEDAWARVARNQVWEPWPMNAMQLRALLKIALGGAEKAGETSDAPEAQTALAARARAVA